MPGKEFGEKTGKQKYYSKKDALKAAADYCAYQERSHGEVRQKLYDLGHYGEDAEELICELILEGFLNEERYARAFAGGKFRIKKWGKIKISLTLKQKGVSPRCITAALKSEIADEDYRNTLMTLAQKHLETTTGPVHKRLQSTARYLAAKGYEYFLIWEVLEELKA